MCSTTTTNHHRIVSKRCFDQLNKYDEIITEFVDDEEKRRRIMLVDVDDETETIEVCMLCANGNNEHICHVLVRINRHRFRRPTM